MIIGEEADANALKVHHSDHAITNDERYGDFGKDIGLGCNVSWIARDIRHSDDLTSLRRSSGNALPELDVLGRRFLVITLAKTASEQAMLLVYQKDAECVEIDKRPHGDSDFREQLVDVQ